MPPTANHRVTRASIEYVPRRFSPVYPAGSIAGRQPRTQPVAWLCDAGHKHIAKECNS